MAETIKEVLNLYIKRIGIKPQELADYAGISRSEYYKRLKDARLWRLGELNAIYDFLNIPKEERIYHE